MSIPFFTGKRAREYVAIMGEAPDGEPKLLEDLGYKICALTPEDLAQDASLAKVDSAVIFQRGAAPGQIEKVLGEACPPLMRSGCRIYVGAVAEHPVQRAHLRQTIARTLAGLGLPIAGVDRTTLPAGDRESDERDVTQPCVTVLDEAQDWGAIARLVTCNPADDPADGSIIIEVVGATGKKLTLDAETEVLVRRAFADCARVHLTREVDGLSEVAVYKAYVELKSGALGAYPYLHFVKVGERAKIEKEFQRYCSTAMEYIPFHLGPRLRRDRCALGHAKGIIVGDYVTGAEKLRDCARQGRAAHIIANLFNHTLHAWRETSRPSDIAVADALLEFWPKAIPVHREPQIRKLGARRSLDELKAMFLQLAPGSSRMGSIHGDLHATNVLARLSDGIVIDFEKVEISKPLVFDPASLEAGLLVDGFIGDTRTAGQVMKSVTPMYAADCFRRGLQLCHPTSKSAWFFDCVRQIRMHAGQMELAQYQYATALALAFIKKGCNPKDFTGERSKGLSRQIVRAMAFVLGERILEELSAPLAVIKGKAKK